MMRLGPLTVDGAFGGLWTFVRTSRFHVTVPKNALTIARLEEIFLMGALML